MSDMTQQRTEPVPRTAAGRAALEWMDDPFFKDEMLGNILAIEAEAVEQSGMFCGRCKHPMHWRKCGADANMTAPCQCWNDVAMPEQSLKLATEGSGPLDALRRIEAQLEAVDADEARWLKDATLRSVRDEIASLVPQPAEDGPCQHRDPYYGQCTVVGKHQRAGGVIHMYTPPPIVIADE